MPNLSNLGNEKRKLLSIWLKKSLLRSRLKAEFEIMALHKKIDLLQEKRWNELMAVQQEQMKLLSGLAEA
jgi:hypothetical protein